MSLPRRVLVVGLIALMASSARAETIWVAGEKPAKSTMNRHPWWYDQVKTDQLSGGDWISNFADKKGRARRNSITAKDGGKFDFWVRANPTATKLITSISENPWQVRKLDGTLRLRRPDASQLRATALDQFGQPTGEVFPADAIRLQPQTLYYAIEAR